MYYEPLFNIAILNPSLFNTLPNLMKIKTLRQKLIFMKDFILTCRDKEVLLAVLGNRFYVIDTDTDFFALADLVEIYKHKFLSWLRNVCEVWVKHILDCELCKAKGSYCGFCKNPDVIYPWNLRVTTQCSRCKSIAHRSCYNAEKCPKCIRIQERKALSRLTKSKQSHS